MRKLPIALLTCAALTAAATAEDWPRYRGANFDGISTEKNWLGAWPGGTPKQLWKKNVGTGFASLTVAGGRVFTIGNNGKQDTVQCFDAVTGAEVWKHGYAQDLDPKYYEGGPSATPTVDGDHVFTLSKQGDVLCLDAKTGAMVWTKNVHKEFGAELPDWGFA